MIYAENILICIAIPLLISLVFIRGSARRFVGAFLAGMGVCLLSAYYSGFISLAGQLESTETAVYISPLVEEILKLLPLLFYLYILQAGDENLLLAAMGVGAGFATFENCCYILSAGADSLTFVVIRGLAVGVMHIVSVLILVLGLVLVKKFSALSFAAIIGAMSLSTTFHALYNLLVSRPGLTSYLGYALPVFTVIAAYFPYKRVFSEVKNKE